MAAQAAVTDVTIYDETDVLNNAVVQDQIKNLSSEQDVHIAVLATDDPSLTEDNYDQDVKALVDNDGYAEIAGEGNETLKQNVVLISISPDLRKLGTYAGDGIPRADQIADKAVGEMRSPARDGDWNEAATAGAVSSLKSVNGDYQREREMRSERFEETVRSAVPFFIALLCLIALVFAGTRLIPSVVHMIREQREEKRLLAWTPSHAEVARSVRYWRDIQRRLDNLAATSPAMKEVSDQAASKLTNPPSENVNLALADMESSGTVPNWVKTAESIRPLIKEGMSEGSDEFWSREVQPLVDRAKAGRRDPALEKSVASASDVRDDIVRFIKEYGKEIDLPSSDRLSIMQGAESLTRTVKHAMKAVDAQESTPWKAAGQIDRERREFESSSKRLIQGPVRFGLSADRKREISRQDIFSNQGILPALLVYSALSSSSSRSSSSNDSSSSYSAINTSISTSGFSGGSGSF